LIDLSLSGWSRLNLQLFSSVLKFQNGGHIGDNRHFDYRSRPRRADDRLQSHQPATGLFYVPVTHICMDYEAFRITYAAGQPYTGADTSVYPPKGETEMGGLIAWDAKAGKII
jgi:hypothetical protein